MNPHYTTKYTFLRKLQETLFLKQTCYARSGHGSSVSERARANTKRGETLVEPERFAAGTLSQAIYYTALAIVPPPKTISPS